MTFDDAKRMANATAAASAPRSAAQLLADAVSAETAARNLRAEASLALAAERAAERPVMPPVEPDLPEFIMFSKAQSGRIYHFAAVGVVIELRRGRNVANRIMWYVTGSEDRRFNWPGLLEFIGKSNWSSMHHFTDSTPILPPGAEPAAAEHVGPFGKIVQAETNTADAFDPYRY